ncbi:MAG: twin-arginine translocation pathway signal protein, partial [Planctomycetes bacterium]|nr:twin-arginine translocation pathway signal protein [Planctomycetota bacterium]
IKDNIPPEQLIGNIALVSHLPKKKQIENDPSIWFADWQLAGDKLIYNKNHAYGPILFNQYTLSRNILKMTAQMVPVGGSDSLTVSMEIQDGATGAWNEIASAPIDSRARTATFRVEDWDNTVDTPYRLVYDFVDSANTLQTAYFNGTIRQEPLEQEEIVVAGFTGNNDLGFPNQDVTDHVKAHDPDFLFFSGDQIYEGVGGYGAQRSPIDKAALDYLRKWYIFGWTYRDLMRDRPSVSIPDDHDVYHGNIWGAGGKATIQTGAGNEQQDSGGYKMPAEWVKMVERTQSSHLPDPYDPTPVEQGIGVYYCDLNYAGISFAVIEDRKFKSAPKGLLPNAQIVNGWPGKPDYNAAEESDVPGAVLLGERQLTFLEDWADDWSGGTWMKVVLSQTIFANVATLPEGVTSGAITPRLPILERGQYARNEWKVHDHDSGGWPQSGRNRALREMRKAFAVHIAGDQHLGSTIQYGIDQWRDGGFALCVPSVSNIWPRRWYPPEPGLNQEPNALGYTGDYKDGFGNLMTVHAVSNPSQTGRQPVNLYDRATGFGLVRFNRSSRDITIECWPRLPELFQDNNGQYPGWPVTINQLDNFGGDAVDFLPTFSIKNLENPVFQVIDESNNETLYTIRINGTQFRPKVFEKGSYTAKIGEPDTDQWKIYENVPSMPAEQNWVVEYAFPIKNF